MSEKMKIVHEAYDTCLKVIESREEFERVELDEGKEFEMDGRINGLTSISTLKVPGLTLEKFKEFRKDAIKHIPVCSARMTAKLAGKEEGFEIFMVNVDMPPMISNRVLFTTQY